MNRIIDVRRNHLEFTIDSKSTSDSVIRFYIAPVIEVGINLSKSERGRTWFLSSKST